MSSKLRDDNWSELSDRIDALLDAPEHQRAGFIEEMSGGDPELRSRLERLREECENESTLLDRPAAERFATLLDESVARFPDSLADRYRVEKELGRGGMAAVFLAHDVKHGRDVAVKVVHPTIAAALGPQRFLREIEIAAQLRHPNIVPLYDSGEADGSLYYVMPYEEGLSLRQRLKRDGALPIDDVVQILRDVCDALAYAHEHGIIHRDIKPDNVLLSGRHAVVTDFGIAKAASAAKTHGTATGSGVVVGTPAYMAPEQIGSPDIDHRADIYAVGVLAYELLTGSTPFTDERSERILAAHLSVAPENVSARRPDIPPQLAEIVMKSLEKLPENRWQSASDIVQRLDAPRGTGNFETSSPMRPPWRRAVIAGAAVIGVGAGAQRRKAAWYGIAALAVALLIVAAWRMRARQGEARAPAAAPPSIAVLPLANLSGDSRDAALADGLTEELIGVLARIDRLRTVARTSAFVFKNSDLDVRQIADSLRVSNILEGSIQRIGQRLRVQVRLIDARDGSNRWSETYDRELKDVFLVQSEIAAAVARELDLRLGGRAAAAARRGPTQNIAAYELYLRGSDPSMTRSDSGVRMAAEHFRQAIALDSNYAAAYAGLARMYNRSIGSASTAARARELAALGRQAALRALALDDSLAEAHAVVGLSRMVTLDLPGAENELRRAIALDPASSRFHEWLGFVYYWKQERANALVEATRAVQNDPLSPNANAEMGLGLCANGRYAEGLARLKRLEAVQPPLLRLPQHIGLCHAMKKDWPAAVAAWDRGAGATAFQAYGRARAGKQREALTILEELMNRWRRTTLGAPDIALVHAGLGDRDQTFEWLNRSLQDPTFGPQRYTMLLLMDDLKADPRYELFRKRLGL